MDRKPIQGPAVGVIAALVVALAGCSGSAESSEPDASICADALDAADRGFDAFAQMIRDFQAAFDRAMNGDPRGATRDLDAIHAPSAARYKLLEEACRDAVAQ